jgi:hypothetical protein
MISKGDVVSDSAVVEGVGVVDPADPSSSEQPPADRAARKTTETRASERTGGGYRAWR